MRIAIFGLGYVGATAACCLASQGHYVLGVDVSDSKVRNLNAGISPIVEPGLDELLTTGLEKGLIEGTTAVEGRLADIDVAIVCVGTPSAPDGSHNMSYIAEVSRQIANAVPRDRQKPLTVAFRSTVRPGTTENLVMPIFRQALGADFERLVELVYNPEFLRESVAINDYFHPPKIVIGTVDGKPSEAMEQLHHGLDAPVFHVGLREAEITKFVDNTWHAVKVAFANEIGRVCQQLDISARKVHEIFVSDTKLNISPYYTRPGGAFGGSCLPKDVRALQYISSDIGANTHLIDTLLRTNEAHKHYQFERISGSLKPGASILLVGLAFKAHTDDLRESPNVDLARKLLGAGFKLSVYDSGLDAAKLVGQNLGYAYSHLPSIGQLLVDKQTAESTAYDVVIATNATIKELTVASPVIDINAIP